MGLWNSSPLHYTVHIPPSNYCGINSLSFCVLLWAASTISQGWPGSTWNIIFHLCYGGSRCMCVQCLHAYETSTVVCHGFQHLCMCLPRLESSNISGLEHIRLLLGMIYFTVPPKATIPPTCSRSHYSVYHLNPYEDSGGTTGKTEASNRKEMTYRDRLATSE